MRVRDPVVEVLEPGQPKHDGAEEETAVHVRPDEDQDGDGPQASRVRPAIDDEQEDDREDRHPDELGPQRQGDGEDEECDQGKPAARRRPETRAQADREEAAEDDGDQRCAEDDQPCPATER